MRPRPSAHQHARAWLGALRLLAACASREPEPVPFEPLKVPAAANFASGDYVFITAAAWSTAWFAAPQQFHADTGVVTLACAHPWSLAVFAKVPALGGDLRAVRFVRRVDTAG